MESEQLTPLSGCKAVYCARSREMTIHLAQWISRLIVENRGNPLTNLSCKRLILFHMLCFGSLPKSHAEGPNHMQKNVAADFDLFRREDPVSLRLLMISLLLHAAVGRIK
jgi:hypothetical protein